MKIINTKFKGLKIIKHKRNKDSRGSLRETYKKKVIKWENFVLEYATISKKNILPFFLFFLEKKILYYFFINFYEKYIAFFFFLKKIYKVFLFMKNI